MKRTTLLAFIMCGFAHAQIPFSHSGEIRATWVIVKGNLTRMLDAMPEDQYAYKPVPEIRSFGELAAHVADVQGRLCAGAAGKAAPASPLDKRTKADLTAAMKDSIASCDAAWDSLTEANAGEKVGNNAQARSRLATLEYNTVQLERRVRLYGCVSSTEGDRAALKRRAGPGPLKTQAGNTSRIAASGLPDTDTAPARIRRGRPANRSRSRAESPSK